jgi:hypothetical protein
MPNKTRIEVHGPHDRVLQNLLSVGDAVPLDPEVESVAIIEIGFGFATAFWIEAEQRTVIIVHDPDHRDAVAAAVFAHLAEEAEAFDIGHGHDESDDFRYLLDYAS